MKINVGSKNKVKVDAIREVIQDYEFLAKAEVASLEAPSGVADQPKSLEETVRGAMNRARKAFKGCDYSVGIEAGLMKVPNTKTEYMNATMCAIYDGEKYHLGMASAFEYPKEVTRLVVEEGLDINDAFYRAGLTKDSRVGATEGAIGILTKGRLPRKEYTKQAISMALIHLENSKLY